jgi:CMP-N-acetylneuraminic acid synthetase
MLKIAVITARQGSKGLPGKNIRMFNGKPLIAWTITAAIKSGVFDRVVVSTDGSDIARVSEEWGASVPYLRPDTLSGDQVRSVDVVVDLVHRLEMAPDDCLCLLQPTSPLREASDIQESYQIMLQHEMAAVVSVTKFKLDRQWMMPMLAEGKLVVPLNDVATARQNVSPSYYPNGAIYWCTSKTLMDTQSFIPAGSIGYEMPFWKSIDIDYIEDFRVAEHLQKNMHDITAFREKM